MDYEIKDYDIYAYGFVGNSRHPKSELIINFCSQFCDTS